LYVFPKDSIIIGINLGKNYVTPSQKLFYRVTLGWTHPLAIQEQKEIFAGKNRRWGGDLTTQFTGMIFIDR